MFIRRTRTRSHNEDYVTFRLVRSERTGTKVQQRTLLNLGRHFEIAPPDWPRLCQRIEDILAGQLPLSPDTPAALEEHAQRIAAQLLARAPRGAPAAHRAPDVQAVDVNSLALLRPRTVGVEQVALWALDQLGLRELLKTLGLGPSLRAAAVGAIVARLAQPGSERAARRWLRERSALDELLGVSFDTLGPMRLYRASDALMAHREAIEKHLFQQALDLFTLAPTITLYDLSNTYFEGEAAHQPQARRGHSKDKRTDCPLLTLGLALDASGFVRRSQVFAGNVREHHTLAGMLNALDTPPGALVVMDRGIATGERLAWLRKQGYRYLVVSRERTRQFDPEGAVRLDTASGHGVQLQRVLDEDAQEVRLYCYSEARAAKEQGIAERFAQRFETALTQLSEGLAKPRTRKRIDQVHQRIGRLKENSHGIAQHYDITVDTDPTGQRATAVRFTRHARPGSMMTHPGVYCLRSSETDWDEDTLWRTCFMLTDVEAVFRALKSELGLRPIYHHKPLRAEGHLFITVIAYQLVQVIRTRLRRTGEHASWTTLRRILEGQQRITATFRRTDGRTLHVRKATLAEPPQQAIYDALGIDSSPGGIQKTLV
ncbi:MAG: IS1634 family transposase [Gammaproteobacteria bacterium]|nr:IS1634 family transposase [Gammaproteobacteria bacterium]